MRSKCLVFVLLLGACASGSMQRVPMPDLDLPLQYPGSCRVYLWRDAGDPAPEATVDIVDQGFAIGHVAAGGFVCWERPPGEAQLLLARSDVDGADAAQSFRVLPGRVYFGRISLAGLDGSPRVTLVPEAQGRILVAELSPADVGD